MTDPAYSANWSEGGRAFKGQRLGHGMRAKARKRSWGIRLSLLTIPIRSLQPRGSSLEQLQTTEVVASSITCQLWQSWRCCNLKRCQSQEIKGGHLSGGLLGFSAARLSGWYNPEAALSARVRTNIYGQAQANRAHSPSAWKKDDGMNDVLYCYTLQTLTHTHIYRRCRAKIGVIKWRL